MTSPSSVDAALAALTELGDAGRARGSAAYHKAPRRYLGAAVPDVDRLTRRWRRELAPEATLELAQGLWRTDVHEARIAATRLLTAARIEPEPQVWRAVAGWVPDFDTWSIADHACKAGGLRLLQQPDRLDEVERWTTWADRWSRRAALVVTLPFSGSCPLPQTPQVRERVLGWAAGYLDDRDWFVQKAVAWWVRSLGAAEPDRARRFVAEHGDRMAPFARREATRRL